MKKIYYLLFTSIFAGGGGVKSQPPEFSCTSSYYCSLDMRDSLFKFNLGQIDSTLNINYSKNPIDTAYKDVQYTSDVPKGSTIPCKGADGCTNSNEALVYQAFFPKKYNAITNPGGYAFYETCPLPVIIMVHGGGFSDCSNKDASDIKFICIELAKRGFVVFDVEYRRGAFETGSKIKNANQQLAVYRAIQDIRGAIRSIIKMAAVGSEFNGRFKFDKNKLFIGGNSAGSGAALCVTYLQKQVMVDAVCPGINNINILGSIDPDYYYAAPSESAYALPVIKGVFDMWGEFPIPGTANTQALAKAFFQQNVYIAPIITFHGDDDKVTTPNNRPVNFPPFGSDEASTSLCLGGGTYTITHTSPSGFSDLIMIGSLSIRDLVQASPWAKFAETYIDCTMEHGLDSPDGPGSGFNSNFGTGFIYEREVQIYMVQRAAIFFQSILINLSNTTITIPGEDTFIECVNKRYNKIDTGNNCVSDSTITSCPTCSGECNTTQITDCLP